MNAKANQVQSASEQQIALGKELEVLKPEIAKVLPEHVSADKFMRVVATAVAQSPELRNADRRSLFTACVKCATDGLVPDGREAALVIFGGKAQYMPMVTGILKKVRNSGELLSIVANVVYERDEFKYWVDDVGEHVLHHPNLTEPDRGKFLCVYAIAKTKDGGVYTEVMTRGQVEEVRSISKSKDSGPWKGWYGEMARKTVIRRLSKRLPMSTDLEAVIRRDDELYDLNQTRLAGKSGTDAAKALLGLPVIPDADDAAAAASAPTGVDTATGEVVGQRTLPEGYDVDATEKKLRACKTMESLVKAWTAIKQDLGDVEVPIAVSAAYTEMRESFEAKAAAAQ